MFDFKFESEAKLLRKRIALFDRPMWMRFAVAPARLRTVSSVGASQASASVKRLADAQRREAARRQAVIAQQRIAEANAQRHRDRRVAVSQSIRRWAQEAAAHRRVRRAVISSGPPALLSSRSVAPLTQWPLPRRTLAGAQANTSRNHQRPSAATRLALHRATLHRGVVVRDGRRLHRTTRAVHLAHFRTLWATRSTQRHRIRSSLLAQLRRRQRAARFMPPKTLAALRQTTLQEMKKTPRAPVETVVIDDDDEPQAKKRRTDDAPSAGTAKAAAATTPSASNSVAPKAAAPTAPSAGTTTLSVFQHLTEPSWRTALESVLASATAKRIDSFLETETKRGAVIFPPRHLIFSAFNYTPLTSLRVVLIGQDPYHDDRQAHGLCFSVLPGIKPPPSLVNMYKELKSDVPGFAVPVHGFLKHWADQGVLMLNATLTVEAHKANSHKDSGWQLFTDAVIDHVNKHCDKVVFLLWGGFAQKKGAAIDASKHVVIACAHPSPLSAAKWFGCKTFSKCNAQLTAMGKTPVDWKLPATADAPQ